MIDREAFVEEMQRLERRFSEELHDDDLWALYDYLSQHLDTDGFLRASQAVWATNRFFPRPADFLMVQSAESWRNLQRYLRDYKPPYEVSDPNETLSGMTMQVVRDMGGLLVAKEEMQRSPVRFRRAFGDAYEAAVVADANTHLPASSDRPGLPAGSETLELPS